MEGYLTTYHFFKIYEPPETEIKHIIYLMEEELSFEFESSVQILGVVRSSDNHCVLIEDTMSSDIPDFTSVEKINEFIRHTITDYIYGVERDLEEVSNILSSSKEENHFILLFTRLINKLKYITELKNIDCYPEINKFDIRKHNFFQYYWNIKNFGVSTIDYDDVDGSESKGKLIPFIVPTIIQEEIK